MLPQAAKDKLKELGLDVDALEAAIKAEEEVEFTVPDKPAGLSPEDQAARDQAKFDEGKKAGESDAKKVLIKEVAKKLGVEAKEDARIGDLVSSIQAEIAKGGDEKLRTLQEQITTLTDKNKDLEDQVSAEKGKSEKASFERQLIGMFPEKRNSQLSDEERLTLIMSVFDFHNIDGKMLVKRNGEILKDGNTLVPVAPKKAIDDYFTERAWVSTRAGGAGAGAGAGDGGEGGRGGGNNAGGAGAGTGLKTRSAAVEVWKQKNPGGNPISPECTAFVNEQAKANADFNMYE